MKNKLKELLEQSHWDITQAVIEEALEYDNPKDFFEDLLQYGCQSGIVSSMIYYKDTHKFYDEHYDEIEDIRAELEEQGVEVKIPSHSDLKNFLAWLSFEHKAYEIYNQVEMNI